MVFYVILRILRFNKLRIELVIDMDTIYKKLENIRKPRVHITYNLEKGDAVEMKELPWVMGVLADLSGQPAKPLPKLKERKFTEVNRGNFADIMKSINPRVKFNVENHLTSKANDALSVELTFNNMDDFNPLEITKRVAPLNEKLQARTRLKDLVAKLDGNDELGDLLEQILSNESMLNELKQELAKA